VYDQSPSLICEVFEVETSIEFAGSCCCSGSCEIGVFSCKRKSIVEILHCGEGENIEQWLKP